METYSSGEELIVKTRKPYTITKQRERWTEEEHNRFLQALKLYGRAWQRIEEHIGTKTAVQIRSHAQKFFSKLEKEALTKGITLGQAHDIEIPPPRPKRKPNNPYPRKTCVGAISSPRERKEAPLTSVSSLCPKKNVLDFKRDAPLEKPSGTQTSQRITKETSEDGNCSEVLSLFQDAPCASMSSASKSSARTFIFREDVPLLKETEEDKTAVGEYSPAVKENKEPKENGADYTDRDIGRLEELHINSQLKLDQERRSVGPKQTQKLVNKELQGNKSYPKHVPVHIIDGSNKNRGQRTYSAATKLTSITNQVGAHVSHNLGTSPSVSATDEHHTCSSMPSIHQPFATFPPFTQFQNNQDADRSFLGISSTFSSLIISTLLQNPAVHAAASLAASFWPTADVKISMDSTSETIPGGVSVRHVNPSPSMAAIAAATVAAASAWWATHGMLPFCHPSLHSGFSFAPAPTASIPTTEMKQPTEICKERREKFSLNLEQKNQKILDPEYSKAPETRYPTSKSLSSSDSEENGGERSHGTEQKASVEQLNPAPDSGLQNSDKANGKKVDRSSCGSNAPSSSEVDTDTVLDKLEKGQEEPKDTCLGHPMAGDLNNRRSRSIVNVNESWKEVSQEGRIAFRALFSREILPQSFSPPDTEDGTVKPGEDREATALPVDLNSKAWEAIDHDRIQGSDREVSTESTLKDNNVNLNIGLMMNEIGQGKSKTLRTGFKPYKRCSMEAKESSRATVGEEKGNKRIRLEGASST